MRRIALILTLFLPLAGVLLGYMAGPFFARADGTVQLAARIWQEESRGLTERTLESEAFRGTGREPSELFAEAQRIERRLSIGGAFFGAWCGLVIALKLFAAARVPKREIYEADPAECVSCGRCFLYCPRERLRLKNVRRA